jgi:hypothetical protein
MTPNSKYGRWLDRFCAKKIKVAAQATDQEVD